MPPSGGTRTSLTGLATATFQPSGGLFSPGLPPAAVDPQPTRLLDFSAGVNLNQTPRAAEPFGFPALRAFANVELVRLAIETRKDQIERLGWSVKSRDARKPPADAETRIRKVERFLRRPDGETSFHTWVRMALEDLLVLDAPAFEARRSRTGELLALDVVPGDTIKILVDEQGRRPRAPLPAYQQVIKGRIWADLSTRDLFYLPRNRRPNHLYGFGPVEQIIVTINTVMRRQAAQLGWFTEGNTPAGMVNAPEGWTPEQIRQFQTWFNDLLSGNAVERSKVMWGPAGAKYQAFKDPPLKDDFDEWLARVVCFAFSLPPTPFIRQMNKGTAQDDDERAMEEGMQPLLLWAKRFFDDLLADEFGSPDLEFSWDLAREPDPEKQAKVHDLYVRGGILTPNEVRDALGREGVPGGEQPLIYTATGAVPLETAAAHAEAALRAAEAGAEASQAKPAGKGAEPAEEPT